MDEPCENCKFVHKLKHNFQVGKGFEESFACNVMISIPDENGKTETTGWIQEVSPSDFCELFTANWGQIMDDLISRQMAIDVLTDEANEDGSYDIDAHDVGMILDSLPSAQQWIPVTESLPKPYSGEYLVTISDGSVYTDILWFDSPGDGRHESCFYKTDDDGHGVVCDDVIAWMPLPEPYKERE